MLTADIGRHWGTGQNIQDIYSMNYKLKSEQSLGNPETPESDGKKFKFSEQYYNIQHDRVMQLPSVELLPKAVGGDRQMGHSREPSEERVVRRMDFHFQKKIEVDKEGLQSVEEAPPRRPVAEEPNGSFSRSRNRDRMFEDDVADEPEEEVQSEKKPSKLMYIHDEHRNQFELKTDALGKFFMDRKNEAMQTKSTNVSSKRRVNGRKQGSRESPKTDADGPGDAPHLPPPVEERERAGVRAPVEKVQQKSHREGASSHALALE